MHTAFLAMAIMMPIPEMEIMPLPTQQQVLEYRMNLEITPPEPKSETKKKATSPRRRFRFFRRR